MRWIQAAIAASIIAAPWASHAQYRPDTTGGGYRDGLPAVNAQPVARDPDATSIQVTGAFRRWYASVNKPALLIFWNRELTDDATTRYADVTQGREETRSTKSAVGGQGATHTSGDDATSKISSQESSKRILTGGEHTPLDPLLSARMETAFQTAWLEAGTELVDRNAIIRKMSTVASQQDRADTQLLESVSLGQGVEYLVEVLPNSTPQGATGLTFLVRVKHLPSATLVAQFLTSAQPPAGAAHWVATRGGFEKQRDNRTTPETMGAELAVEVMQRMAR